MSANRRQVDADDLPTEMVCTSQRSPWARRQAYPPPDAPGGEVWGAGEGGGRPCSPLQGCTAGVALDDVCRLAHGGVHDG